MHKRIWAGLLGLAWAAGVAGQAVPSGTGLVAYWTLNDTNSTALDTAGAAPTNDGTYMGTTLPTTSSTVPQAFGLAHPPGNTASRVFTQGTSGQRVEVPNAADLNLTGDFTLAAWVRPTGAQTNQMGILEKWADNPGGINGSFLRLSSTMVPRISTGNGTTQVGLDSGGGPLTANVWSHVAFSFEAGSGTMRLYVNGGAPSMQTGAPVPTANTSVLHIGVDYGANRFNGNIDDVRIYSRRLDTAEIGVLANGLATPVISSLTPGPGTVDVAWAAVPNATSYLINQGPTTNGPWTPAGTSTTTSFTDFSVTNPNQYFYQVIAVSLIQSNPSASLGPVVPQSLVPRTKDHEEGLFDDNCACGSSIVRPLPLAALVLAVLPLLLRRRS